ncbi:MAG: hypothetical protein ACREFC_05050, partial [Stellaceae bacterium]
PSAYLALQSIAIANIAMERFDEAAAAARKTIDANTRFPMAYAWAIVSECGRGDKARIEELVPPLLALMPGFKRDAIPTLFSYFPPAIRDKCQTLMRAQGIPAA